MKDINIEKAYEAAKERYSAIRRHGQGVGLTPENLSFPPLLAGR